jgi:hypothetical protein
MENTAQNNRVEAAAPISRKTTAFSGDWKPEIFPIHPRARQVEGFFSLLLLDDESSLFLGGQPEYVKGANHHEPQPSTFAVSATDQSSRA